MYLFLYALCTRAQNNWLADTKRWSNYLHIKITKIYKCTLSNVRYNKIVSKCNDSKFIYKILSSDTVRMLFRAWRFSSVPDDLGLFVALPLSSWEAPCLATPWGLIASRADRITSDMSKTHSTSAQVGLIRCVTSVCARAYVCVGYLLKFEGNYWEMLCPRKYSSLYVLQLINRAKLALNINFCLYIAYRNTIEQVYCATYTRAHYKILI